jgi:hypothetical protein
VTGGSALPDTDAITRFETHPLNRRFKTKASTRCALAIRIQPHRHNLRGAAEERFRNVSETPRLDTGHVDMSIETPTARHGNCRGFVPFRLQTSVMQPSKPSSTTRTPLVRRRASSAVLASRRRSGNVPGGGRRGGLQTSAPQVHPQALLDTPAASHGHATGTVTARFTVGPTAHRSNPTLRVLRYCCCAQPSWIDL